MVISRACERYFGGYAIGTCLIFTSLFGTAVDDAPNFLFFVGTVWTSVLMVLALFFIGRLTGWLVPVDTPLRTHVTRASLARCPTIKFAPANTANSERSA